MNKFNLKDTRLMFEYKYKQVWGTKAMDKNNFLSTYCHLHESMQINYF